MRMLSPVFSDVDLVLNTFVKPACVSTATFHPSCDVDETDDHYLVSLDMPGVKKEDIKIELQKDQLIITGERNRETQADEGVAWQRKERRYGKFERTFTLPATINAEKIEAQYENGVLSVAIPKAEAAKARSIQIQAGPSGFFSKLLTSKKETSKEFKDAH